MQQLNVPELVANLGALEHLLSRPLLSLQQGHFALALALLEGVRASLAGRPELVPFVAAISECLTEKFNPESRVDIRPVGMNRRDPFDLDLELSRKATATCRRLQMVLQRSL
jgi:hypothetical protein